MKQIEENKWEIESPEKRLELIEIVKAQTDFNIAYPDDLLHVGIYLSTKEVSSIRIIGDIIPLKYYPVGYIEKNHASLINRNIESAESYHSKLREIYDNFQ